MDSSAVVTTSPPVILLVDDFRDALEMYAEYLQFRGLRIATAASGHEAVEMAQRERPVLILMDLEMRGLSGTQAMKELRADRTLDGVPILAFTAHALAAERDLAMHNGFDGVIPKPCLPDELLAIIERYLPSQSNVPA